MLRLEKIPTKLIIIADLLLAIIIANLIFKNEGVNNTNKSYSEEEFRKAGTVIWNICKGQTGWDCYNKEFYKLTGEKGFTFAEQTLYMMGESDISLRNCHIISHHISRAATRKDPDNWKKLLGEVNVSSCGGGFIHGILEAHLADNPDFKISSEFIYETCSPLKDNGAKIMCSHGLGHLILVENLGDLEKSVTSCDGLVEADKTMARECYIGMFMEDHQRFALSEHEISPLPSYGSQYLKSVKDQCLRYKGLPAVACWNEVAEIAAKSLAYDPNVIYKECYDAPTEEEGNYCYLKGVALLAVFYNFDTTDKLLSICNPYEKDNKDQMYQSCINYAISSLIGYTGKFTDRAILICSNIDTNLKEGCFKNLGFQLKRNVTLLSERQALCQSVPDAYKLYCISP